MITENVLGIEAPCALFLVAKDPDQDLIQSKRPLCIIILSLGGTTSVIDRSLDRDRVVFDIRPLEAERFAWSHTGAEKEAPEEYIPLVGEFVHEPSGLVRLKDFLAFLFCVSGDAELRKGFRHKPRSDAELREIDQYTTDIRKRLLRQRFAVLLGDVPQYSLIVVKTELVKICIAQLGK